MYNYVNNLKPFNISCGGEPNFQVCLPPPRWLHVATHGNIPITSRENLPPLVRLVYDPFVMTGIDINAAVEIWNIRQTCSGPIHEENLQEIVS